MKPETLDEIEAAVKEFRGVPRVDRDRYWRAHDKVWFLLYGHADELVKAARRAMGLSYEGEGNDEQTKAKKGSGNG